MITSWKCSLINTFSSTQTQTHTHTHKVTEVFSPWTNQPQHPRCRSLPDWWHSQPSPELSWHPPGHHAPPGLCPGSHVPQFWNTTNHVQFPPMSLLPVILTGLVPASAEQYIDDDDEYFYIVLFSALEQTLFHIPSPFVLTLHHRICWTSPGKCPL